jgi:lipopolysaccharide/colanic/teichoic acid biosynthesis glycosyltransferase/glycosyltransferase involved in cell wall biosynthesis
LAEQLPLYSVIVPAYQAAGSLGLCLDALNAQTVARELYEVIVVDDGSTDGTGEIARRAGARVIVQRNAGAAAARNAGAAVARGDLLLFTDADCAPVPGWVAALVAPFADSRVAGAKGTYLTRQRKIVSRFTQLEYEDRYDRMAGVETIDFVDTYSAAYRRDIFLANAGFDPAFLFDEDQEFSFRLTEKGYRLVFAPAAQVYHRHNTTLAAYIRRKFLMGHWKVLVTRRHPGRAVKDSHTPQTLKLQMGLAAATLAAFLLAALASLAGRGLWAPALGIGILTVLLFALTEISFLVKVWRRDRGVTLAAVGLLWVRAFALGTGFALGLVHFRGRLAGSRSPIAGWQQAAKRLIDIVLGGLVLVIIALPMAGIALVVKLDSPGPIFFRQTRVGQDGRLFRIFKFRTMVDHAEEMLTQLVDLETLAQPAFKLRDDPRVTRAGRVLRRWSLDEVPQLFNVLAGEMSLVGPRPEQVEVVARYTDDQRRRLAVKPGMTGPMQVNGRGDLPFEERLALELAYIGRYSLRRDLSILLRTIPAVVRGDGAY